MSEDLLLHPAAPPHMSRKKTVSFRKHPTCSGRNLEHTHDAGPLRRETPHRSPGPCRAGPTALLLLAQQSRRRGAAPLSKHARAIRPHGGGPGTRLGRSEVRLRSHESSHARQFTPRCDSPGRSHPRVGNWFNAAPARETLPRARARTHAGRIRGPGPPSVSPTLGGGFRQLPPALLLHFLRFLSTRCPQGKSLHFRLCETPPAPQPYADITFICLTCTYGPCPPLSPEGMRVHPHGTLQLALQMSARNGNLSSNKLRLRHEDRTRTSQLLGSRGTKGQKTQGRGPPAAAEPPPPPARGAKKGRVMT